MKDINGPIPNTVIILTLGKLIMERVRKYQHPTNLAPPQET